MKQWVEMVKYNIGQVLEHFEISSQKSLLFRAQATYDGQNQYYVYLKHV